MSVEVESALSSRTYQLTLEDRVINGRRTGPMYRGRVLAYDSAEVEVQIECMGTDRNTVALAVEKWPREQTRIEELT